MTKTFLSIFIFFSCFSDFTKHVRICSETLPFSLIHDLEGMLGKSHFSNFKHLADKLGYSFSFIKRLSVAENPVEKLLADYCTKECPTKEELCWALSAIDRGDVAKYVHENL